MQKMSPDERSIRVFFGQSGSGKTHFFNVFRQDPGYQHPHGWAKSVDDIRVQYFGKRIGLNAGVGHADERQMRALYDQCTAKENNYAYTFLFQDAERALIVDGVKTVLIEANLRSFVRDYDLLVALVGNVRGAIQRIDNEPALKQGMLPPDPPSELHLQTVLLFCDLATILERRRRRPYQNYEENLHAFARQVVTFQFPNFPFLAVDTSDESPEAEVKRLAEITDFFAGRECGSLMATRAEEARNSLAAMQMEVRKRGLAK